MFSIQYLMNSEHTIFNLDQVIFDTPRVMTCIAKITKANEIYDVMSGYANYRELISGTGVPSFDALARFAAIPQLLQTSGQ